MKQNKLLALFFILVAGAMLSACAPKPRPYLLEAPPPFILSDSPPETVFSCNEKDLNPLVASGEYVRKVDNFLVVLDASSTMSEKQTKDQYTGVTKLPLARDILKCMNLTIPDLELTSGLREFGPVHSDQGRIYGMTAYTKPEFEAAVNKVAVSGGTTPIANALDYAGMLDLQETTGRTALILVSDGMNTAKDDPIASAQQLKQLYGDNLCIYTILMGDDTAGAATMTAIADSGQCGFATEAFDFRSSKLADGSVRGNPDGMADFVKAVFLAHENDSDGDGVFDSKDKCPGTPKGVAVDKDGCPIDSDGDGVPDYLDKCPDTPKGMKVDSNGCPYPEKEQISMTLKVQFDFDKAVVKPEFANHLKEVADFLKTYPTTVAELQGHTCDIGTESYNLKLSQRRADSVRKYLIEKHGIAADRLTAKGYGESQPIASNKTEDGRKKNRRTVADIVTIMVK